VNQSIKSRLDSFDSLKGLLIFLVVFGHCLEAKLNSPYLLAIYKSIYLFHMPFFIFLSGFFFKNIKSHVSILKKILFVYFAAQIFYAFSDSWIYDKSFVIKLHRPNWGLWYLLSLFYWKETVYLIKGYIDKYAKCAVALSFLIAIALSFLSFSNKDALFMSWTRTLVFMPFFIMGYLFKENKSFVVEKTPAKFFVHALCMLSLMVVALYVVMPVSSRFLYGTIDYKRFGGSAFLLASYRVFYFLVVSAWCLFLLEYRKYIPVSLNRFGKYSLCIYLGHFVVLDTLKSFHIKKVLSSLNSSLVLGGVVFLSFLICFLLSQQHIGYLIKKLVDCDFWFGFIKKERKSHPFHINK
jgi:fucose 4-O-acetylase-like acetyltransferase